MNEYTTHFFDLQAVVKFFTIYFTDEMDVIQRNSPFIKRDGNEFMACTLGAQ